MQVADPAQIAAISHYSQDPKAASIPLAQARRFRITYGTAEEVVALRPDLVIAGRHVALATRNALARLGVRILFVDVPQTIAESDEQIMEIAGALGHPARGVGLTARIGAAFRAARPGDGRTPAALIWQGGGLVPGQGTLADEVLRKTGYANASASYGLKQWDVLPLEYLLARPPAVIFTAIGENGPQGARSLRHRALARLAGRVAVRDYPERLLHCAGPTLIDAAQRLAEVRRELEGKTR